MNEKMTIDQLNKAIEKAIWRLNYLRDEREDLQLKIYGQELLQKQLIKMKKDWIARENNESVTIE